MTPTRTQTLHRRETLVGPTLRQGLIERVRREIAAGTYDTEEKMEIALERMLGCVADEREEPRRG